MISLRWPKPQSDRGNNTNAMLAEGAVCGPVEADPKPPQDRECDDRAPLPGFPGDEGRPIWSPERAISGKREARPTKTRRDGRTDGHTLLYRDARTHLKTNGNVVNVS